ncbi:alpha/beta-hydrolase family protein [soil metagenome]
MAETTPSTPGRPGRPARAVAWVFRRRLCFGGLVGALVALCCSLTPSLLPRGWILQGVVSGVTVAIGYGLGSMLSSWVRTALRHEPPPRVKQRAWWTLLGATVVLVPLFLVLAARWQEDVRGLMDMELLETYEWLGLLVVTLIMGALLLVISRVVRGGTRGLIRLIDRWMPRPVAYVAGVVIATVAVVGLVQGFLLDGLVDALDAAYSVSDGGTSNGVTQPTSSLRSGGPGSLVPWDTLGVKGRDFAGDGWAESTDDLETFSGGAVEEPIRVYVGLESADTLDERVDLAVSELERTKAFDRKVLVVVTTTGTGWVDANVSNSIEYMYGGDTAIVALQYSYLPSWVSFLVDRSKASSAADAMIAGVADRWAEEPEDTRAKLLVFGESLGSYGTEHSFDGLDDLTSTVDGALLEGPTFANPLRNEFTDDRDKGSPAWLPVFEKGRVTRFPDDPGDFDQVPGEWTEPRVAYLQNATDPISFFSFDLLWQRPDWLDAPRAPDVSDDMVWIPIVTFWQVAADLTFAGSVPQGHGHHYGSAAADGWAAVAAPPGWTDADTERLKAAVSRDIEQINALKS